MVYAGDSPNPSVRIGRDLSGLLRAMDREYKNENEIREYEVMIEQIIAQQNAPVIS